MQGSCKWRRPFATGSKPGPDAVDHYLESQGFYRKHVARDASSLFRVISEQIFDVQNYHEKIRQDCAAFMETRSKEYGNEVDKNFYNYISHLRRPRTHGGLLELRVMARMYRRNVIIFEPTPNLQTIMNVYVHSDAYDQDEPLRVFYSHKDKHFDVIYTMEYVERLAECQAIVYNVLYTEVFRLPDVQYSVERMLHDQDEQITLPLADDPSKYTKQSGEIIPFDSHAETNCVLKDPKTCHFHNQVNFEEVVNESKDSITVINRSDDPGRLKIFKPIDGFLHNMDKSCVRQLLDEGITPFPYKVAKALDPSIYRNTEFELWSENRREQRLKWLESSDFPMKHHDDKWIVYDAYNKCHRNSYRMGRDSTFEQAVLDESAYRALDDESKKKYIVLDPSTQPFKLQHLTGMDHFVPSKDALNLTVMPLNTTYNRDTYKKRGGGRYTYHRQNSNFHQGNSYHHHQYSNFHQGNRNEQHFTPSQRENPQTQAAFASEAEREPTFQYQETQEVQFYSHQNQSANFYQPVPQMVSYIPQQPAQFQIPVQYSGNYQNIMPYGNFSIPPPQPFLVQQITASSDSGDPMNILREQELSSTVTDFNPKESVEKTGSDLPLNDIATLQFYFNLGVRYFLVSGVQRRLESVASQLQSLEVSDNSTVAVASSSAEDKATEKLAPQAKFETPPAPTNTPVTTKSSGGNFAPPGNRGNFHGGSYGNYRRPFSSNREGSRDNYRGNWNNQNPRKEIKFNSNVKNVHKAETKPGNNGFKGSQSVTVQTLSGNGNGNLASYASIAAAATTTTADHHEDASPPAETGSQFSSMPQDARPGSDQHQMQQQEYQACLPPPPPFSPYQQQTYLPQQQQVAMVYQMSEDGYMMHQVRQPVNFAPPYQFPVYYPMPSYQQPQISDGTMVSNDSGVAEPNIYHVPAYQQFYSPYQQPLPQVPLYYAPTPWPQTPQIATIPPVFPTPGTQIATLSPPVEAHVGATADSAEASDQSGDQPANA